MCSLSTWFSVMYLAVLLPGTILAYAILPQRLRRVVLLAVSYGVFWLISGKLLGYLLLATLITHYIGIWLALEQGRCAEQLADAPKEHFREIRKSALRRQKCIIAFGVLLLLGILLVLKYSPFFADNFNDLLKRVGISVSVPVPSFLLPIGISFYTLQAISYLLDVSRGKIPADRNILRLALFLSFFPQLMEGPICRYSDTAQRLWGAPPIRWENLTAGLQRILWGMIKKMVVADRLNLLIQNVFGDYQSYDGLAIAAAAVCYTIQLYMDFSGTMDLVIGTGQIFGITLPENFRQPFFSKTISEFWRRWHITLGAFFRDYLFYPVSLSKPMKKLSLGARKKLGSHYGALCSSGAALFCVWLCNGLWHGAGWNYIFFGMYHFVLILAGNLVEPPVAWVTKGLHINRSSCVYKGMQILRTTALVIIGELFFRANGLRAGLEMFQRIFTSFSLATLEDRSFWGFGLDWKDGLIVLATVILIFVVSVIHERGISLRAWVSGQKLWIRFGAVYLLILYIVVFGAYGEGYVPVDPIYAAF